METVPALVRAVVRVAGALHKPVQGAHGDDGLDPGREVEDRVADEVAAAVAGRRDDDDAGRFGVLERLALNRRHDSPAKAQVDHVRAMIDRPVDAVSDAVGRAAE